MTRGLERRREGGMGLAFLAQTLERAALGQLAAAQFVRDNAGADEVLVQAQGSRRVRPRLFPFARLEFELRAPQQGQRQVDGVLAARICEGHRAVGGGSGGSVVAARLAEQRLLGGERGERHVTGRQHSLESRLQLLEEGRGSREIPMSR